MIVKKRNTVFVARQDGLAVLAVIAPTRKQAFDTANEIMGSSHGDNGKQRRRS